MTREEIKSLASLANSMNDDFEFIQEFPYDEKATFKPACKDMDIHNTLVQMEDATIKEDSCNR